MQMDALNARLTSRLLLLQLAYVWLLETHSFGKDNLAIFLCNIISRTLTNIMNTTRTFNESDVHQLAIQHVCLKQNDGATTYSLPTQPCLRMRAETFFPSCWDGKNLDSADHKSHVSQAHPLLLPTSLLFRFYT